MTQNIRANLKILVVGSSGTGKTSFIQRWTKGEFTEISKPTIVSEFSFKIYVYKEKKYRIQLWDLGGQDKTPTMAKIFARDSHGCLVISDCTKKETLEETLDWKKVINEESNFVDGQKLPFILIQNKIDLIKDKMELEDIENDTKKIGENNEFIKYFMSSVKENINIDNAMEYLIGNIVDRLEIYANSGGICFAEQLKTNTIKLHECPTILEENKKKCC